MLHCFFISCLDSNKITDGDTEQETEHWALADGCLLGGRVEAGDRSSMLHYVVHLPLYLNAGKTKSCSTEPLSVSGLFKGLNALI